MTALRQSFHAHRMVFAAVALVLALVVALGLVRSPVAEAHAERPIIAPATAAALVQATTGVASTQVEAVGERAELINASLPFDRAPVLAARPFEIAAGENVDHRRALLCLTQAVYYEAGFEPMEGRRAVAQVVLNRMRHPAFPKSVCGVVYQGSRSPVCQFSFVCDGALYRRPAPDAWAIAREIAAAALAGYVERSVGSATHYHADYVAPRWAPMLSKVAKLGAHIFYRWPGAWGMPAAFSGRYIGEPSDPLALRPPLRVLPVPGGDTVIVAGQSVYAGPPVARAANDVGGLLDTTKGWTLNIPMPNEAGAATKAIAEAQGAKVAPKPSEIEPAVADIAIAAPVLASR